MDPGSWDQCHFLDKVEDWRLEEVERQDQIQLSQLEQDNLRRDKTFCRNKKNLNQTIEIRRALKFVVIPIYNFRTGN